jgi:hypothetical protein
MAPAISHVTSGLSEKQPKGKILSRKIVPESVIQILKMKPGRTLRMGCHCEHGNPHWNAQLTAPGAQGQRRV